MIVVARGSSKRVERNGLSGQAGSDLIKDYLLDEEPVMIARLGRTELHCLAKYLMITADESVLLKSVHYLMGRAPAFWWTRSDFEAIVNLSGFFPADRTWVERFCELLLRDLGELDLLGSWLKYEHLVDPFHGAVKVPLRALEPYYHRAPWSEALGGRTVLVVHPFSNSIARQYSRRSVLFRDERILPAFELRVLQAVQSLVTAPPRFDTWFDAYEHMCAEISGIDFDVALLGCGAYGLPLAAHVKRLGKKSVHLGGALQILFGIKGRRWDEHETISGLYNEHWIRPLASERPKDYQAVEGGCYW
jgi:hypothetical protein